MPRGDGTGPPWGGGPGSGKGARRCLGVQNSIRSKTGGSRVERYVGIIEMLVPLASAFVALFKKPKTPQGNITTFTRVGAETDQAQSLKRGDEDAER